jgi:ferredoxin/protein involved in ribonucleotide reduction
MKIFYFSSTGNNLYIAKRLGGQAYSIPKLLNSADELTFEDESIGIVFPCYYLGVPRIVKEFIGKVKLKSNYLFAIESFGNMSLGTVNQFFSLTKKYGINLSYLNEICMVDNYIPLFDMNKQKSTASGKHIEENLKQLIDDILQKKQYIKKKSVCNSAFTYFAQHFYKFNTRKADSRFTVENTCNSCGICQRVCPVNNIKVTTRPEFQHHCDECFSCTHNCPQNAIRVKGEKSRARFVNEHVTVKEIIVANE